MEPLISVIVPVLNSGAYLRPCLDSIAAQSHHRLQVILVDDGSTDGSAELCAEYARRDPRFTLLAHTCSGVSAARGAGFALAQGEYIAFADSDDLLHPQMLAVLLAAQQAVGLPLSCCRYDTFSDTPPAPQNAPETFTVLRPPEHRKALLRDHAVDYGLWNKLYRRGLLHAEDFEREFRFNEDLLINWEAFGRVEGLAFADFAGYHYRKNPQSATRKTLAPRNLQDQRAVARLICRQAEGSDLEGFCRGWYFEKLLYLYSLILRQDSTREHLAEAHSLRDEIAALLPDAETRRSISASLRVLGFVAARTPALYRLLCRLLLKNR